MTVSCMRYVSNQGSQSPTPGHSARKLPLALSVTQVKLCMRVSVCSLLGWCIVLCMLSRCHLNALLLGEPPPPAPPRWGAEATAPPGYGVVPGMCFVSGNVMSVMSVLTPMPSTTQPLPQYPMANFCMHTILLKLKQVMFPC
jgi:hypothetical protein